MDPRIELRREPVPDLGAVGEDAALVERIRAEIRAGGPMPFARFMALALYDPDGGYYRSAEVRPGRGGDFLTAPELHPIFGASLAVGLRDIWDRLERPEPFVIREHGAGTGALAVSILDALTGPDDAAFLSSIRYEPVEVDPRRIEAFEATVSAAGHMARIGRPGAEPFDGVVLANEVLDALPVHRVRRRGDDLRELAVDVGPDGRLVEIEIAPTTPVLAARLDGEGVALVDGQTAEICLTIDAWLAAATAGLRRGSVLLIDYGAPAAELYDPRRRRDGTLRAYVRHRVHDDPLVHVGRQDLTAHVDVTAVTAAATTLGLSMLGVTTQAEALMGLGIEERLRAVQADPTTTPEAYTLLRSALLRLLDPAAMGRFRVIVLARGWGADADRGTDAPPRILSYHLPDRTRPRPTAPY